MAGSIKRVIYSKVIMCITLIRSKKLKFFLNSIAILLIQLFLLTHSVQADTNMHAQFNLAPLIQIQNARFHENYLIFFNTTRQKHIAAEIINDIKIIGFYENEKELIRITIHQILEEFFEPDSFLYTQVVKSLRKLIVKESNKNHLQYPIISLISMTSKLHQELLCHEVAHFIKAALDIHDPFEILGNFLEALFVVDNPKFRNETIVRESHFNSGREKAKEFLDGKISEAAVKIIFVQKITNRVYLEEDHGQKPEGYGSGSYLSGFLYELHAYNKKNVVKTFIHASQSEWFKKTSSFLQLVRRKKGFLYFGFAAISAITAWGGMLTFYACFSNILAGLAGLVFPLITGTFVVIWLEDALDLKVERKINANNINEFGPMVSEFSAFHDPISEPVNPDQNLDFKANLGEIKFSGNQSMFINPSILLERSI